MDANAEIGGTDGENTLKRCTCAIVKPNIATPIESTEDNTGLYECPICFEPAHLGEPMFTKCGHVFCSNCIRTTVKQFKHCPVCRNPLTIRQLFILRFWEHLN